MRIWKSVWALGHKSRIGSLRCWDLSYCPKTIFILFFPFANCMITPHAIRKDVFLTRHFCLYFASFSIYFTFLLSIFIFILVFFGHPFPFFLLLILHIFPRTLLVIIHLCSAGGGGEGGERGVFLKAIYTSAAVTVDHGVSKNEESGGITAVIHESQLHLFH